MSPEDRLPEGRTATRIASNTEVVSVDAENRPVIVLTTLGAQADAAAFARVLVDERLAGCVNVLPAMTSVYRWEGAVQQEDEEQVVIKTSTDRLAALEARLRQLHPYELPEFLVITADAGAEAYLKWVGASTHDVRAV